MPGETRKQPQEESRRGREGRETKMPKMEFEIFFGSHATAQDAEAFLSKAKDADIIGFEASGIKPSLKNLIKKLSAGEEVTYKLKEDDYSVFAGGILHGIRGIKKPILLADLKPGLESSLYEMHNALTTKQMTEAILDFRDGDFSRAMQRIKRIKNFLYKPHLYREKIVAARLQGEAQKLIKGDPILRKKALVRIGFFLGLAHSPIMSERSLPETTRMHINTSQLKDYHIQVMQMLRRKKHVPDLLYARMIVESVITKFFEQKYGMSNAGSEERMKRLVNVLDAAHLIAQRLSEEDIQSLSATLGKAEAAHTSDTHPDESFFLPEQMEAIETHAAQKGIPTPSSVDELGNFVATYGPRWKFEEKNS